MALKHIVCVTSNSVDRRQKLTEMAALSPDDDRDRIMPPISELALIYINDHCEHGMLLHISRSKQDFAPTFESLQADAVRVLQNHIVK